MDFLCLSRSWKTLMYSLKRLKKPPSLDKPFNELLTTGLYIVVSPFRGTWLADWASGSLGRQ
jgi:hypothetical protein